MAVGKFGFLTIALAIALPTIVYAETAAAVEPDANDPQLKVCKKSQVTGSRLGKKKVCMSQAQWDVQRQADREKIEQTQALRYKGNER